jgi:tetratricopeptide (TPR) repeat protein
VKEDWQRWNDYGIGLLLQGDLKAAQAAFEKVTEIDPQNPDGWVNIGRAALQEGDVPRARTVLEKALAIESRSCARAISSMESLMKRRATTIRPPRICKSSLRNIPATASR